MTHLDRNSSVVATIKNRYPLTKEGSTKQTWHVSLDLRGVDFEHIPGDSIGIYPQNDPTLVEHILIAMGACPEDKILHKRSGETIPVHEFLTYRANLARITSSFLKLIHEKCPHFKDKTQNLLEDKVKLKSYLSENDPLGLLREFSNSKLPLQDLCDQFGPLLPRFYSIASSRLVDPHTLDLTVALFTWMQGGEKRYGVASHFLCHLAEMEKTPVPFFLQPARQFRLPADSSVPIIMIGPGTGVAPFRAFMQERALHYAKGKHWLFFGERNRENDFFYEQDWKAYPNLVVDTAFSRDQEEKVYVQHKMLEQGGEIAKWIDEGAHIYVCGDAEAMAKDVDHALHQILEVHHPLSHEDARAYLKKLKHEGRYQLDVY